MSLKCVECGKEFSLKSNLTRHLRMVHNLDVPREDIQPAGFEVHNYKCLEGCQISFRYNRNLRTHLRDKHGIETVVMNLDFPNSEEFEKWLHEEETNNCVQFIHLTATKRRSTGVEAFYYECSRSGNKRAVIDENQRKRKAKKFGTVKLSHGCTSQIIVNKLHDESYSVIYFKTHYGHDNEIEHMKLSKQDRGAIASKLLLGMPISSVLNSTKTSSENLKRVNLISRKDVVNITRSFNIPIINKDRITADLLDINQFLSECALETDNPILHSMCETDEIFLIILTKHQINMLQKFGNNILLIHSTTLTHNNFYLIVIFVITKSGVGFPAACMITNKNDYSSYELFFYQIREKINRLFPKILITNCSEIYYEAWKNVMSEVETHYYNPLSISLDWRLNLNRIACVESDVTKVKRKWVYDSLKIIENIEEASEFLDSLEETIKMLEKDEDFKEFLDYFIKVFSDSKKWANCYQNCHLPRETLEVLDDGLKLYLKQNDEKRFDKIFHNLVRFLRDQTVDYLLKTGTDPNLFLSENDLRHQLMMERNFNVSNINEDTWLIIRENDVYVVQRHLKKTCCQLRCTFCNICIHYFSCTCVDFFVNNVICEHVHFVWVTFLQSLQTESDENEEEESKSQSEQIIIEVYEEQPEVNTLRSEIFEITSLLNSKVANIADEGKLKEVLDAVGQLCDLCDSSEELEGGVGESSFNETVIDDHSYL